MEVTLSIGLLSFGFLALAPMLATGMKAARLARDDRATSQIALTLEEEARQGTLPDGTPYFDDQGAACSQSGAAYAVTPTTQTLSGNASQLTLRVTPIGAPERARVYAFVYQAPAAQP